MNINIENKLENQIGNILGIEPEEVEEESETMLEGAVDDDGIPIDGQEDDGVCR